MPRGRPKGSKNRSKEPVSTPQSLEGREWVVKEQGKNGIKWTHPYQPPYLTKEEADAIAVDLLKSNYVASAVVVKVDNSKPIVKKVEEDADIPTI